MKTFTLLLAILFPASACFAAEDPKTLLRDALFAEEVEQDAAKAADLYQRMIAQAGDWPKQLAVARYRLAKIALAAGRKAEAVEQLKAIATTPITPPEWVVQANQLLKEIQPDVVSLSVDPNLEIFNRLKDRIWNWHSGDDLHGKPSGAMRFLANGKVETTRGIDWLAGWEPVGPNRVKIIQIQGIYWIHELSPDGSETRCIDSTPPLDTEKRLAQHSKPSISIDEAEIGFLEGILTTSPQVVAEWNIMANLAKLDRPKALAYLLDQGIPVDLREGGAFRWTPLMYAVGRGSAQTTKLLLDRGADVNALDTRGAGSVMIAVWRGEAELVELLVSRGADIRRASSFTYPEYPKLEMGTALHVAAMRGNLRAVGVLIDHGADVNAVSPRKRFTPLNCALGEGHPEIAKALLNRGADPNLPLDGPVHPLRQAAHAGNIEIVRLMLAKGARMDIQSDHILQICGVSRTVGAALPAAVREGHLKIAQILVEAGCPVDQTTPQYHETPLHAAGLNGNASVCKWLLEKGANPKHPLADGIGFQSGWMPLHSAAWRGSTEVANLLMAKGASPEDTCGEEGFRRTAFHLAVLKGSLPLVKSMLALPIYQNPGARKRLLSQPDGQGNTALHFAMSREAAPNIELVKFLVASGAPQDAVNQRNQTPRQLGSDMNTGTRDNAVRRALDP